MRRVLCVCLFLFAFWGCGTKASLGSGEYTIRFELAKGRITSTSVEVKTGASSVSKSGRGELLKMAEPLILNEIRSANLYNASGFIDVAVLPMRPLTLQIRSFQILEPNFQDLAAAVQNNDVQRIRELIARWNNVNQRELPSQQTALSIAAAGGCLNSLQVLLELGADPNLPDNIGVTPLMNAVIDDNPRAVETLLAKGARPSVANKAGDTALTIAEKLHRDNLLPLLRRTNGAV